VLQLRTLLKVKQQRRAITEMGYNGSAIEFNRYEKTVSLTDAVGKIRVGSEPLYLTYS